tara:strand:+ start:266 stop:673 length:408 start_codon:yes stop_codon:yes gene_type:complete
MQKLKMIPCPKCGNPFPELRLTQYGYNFCVDCSDVESVVGITTVEGSGDHTYNDIIIMDRKKALGIAKAEAEAMGRKAPDPIEILNMDRDEMEISQSIKEKVNNVLDEDNSNVIVTNDADPNDDDTHGLIKGIDY